jgi:hypothetical protein
MPSAHNWHLVCYHFFLKGKNMKRKLMYSTVVLFGLGLFTACGDKGNTGNGSVDTPIKHGSGYSDSANPERGDFDRTQTPNEHRRTENQNK